VATNLDTITAAITEDHEHLLLAYCVAYAKAYVLTDDAPKALQMAQYMALQERKSANRTLDMDRVTVKQLDVRGQLIGDASNAEGFNVDVDGEMASDL
jgi:hypothetical protein